MTRDEIKKLSNLLVTYCVGVKKGEKVLLNGTTYSEELLLELYKSVLDAGGHPSLNVSLSTQQYAYFTHAQDHHLDYCDQRTYRDMEVADIMIALRTMDNMKELSGIAPERLARKARASFDINLLRNKRESEGAFRWVLGPYPTQSMAQEAGMSLEEYEALAFRACHLDKEDPVAEWERVSAEQQKLCDWLEKRDEFRFVGRDTDLTMSCKGRTWVNCDGHVNMPDGEVFTGPIEDSVNGTISFTYPAIFQGNEVRGVQLSFKDGEVSKYHASMGESFLGAMIGTDDGSNKVGEIAIGTNYGIDTFTRLILFDEKIGGTMHMALGNGIVQSGSVNKSSIHWDMLKDMKDGGRMYADGELFYENGKVIIDI
jgi:aminopeptidase